MSEKTSTRHEEWLKKERPQTFAALQDTEGDSEDLKSCCVRLEQEVAELRVCCSDVCEFLKKLKQQANQTTEKPLFSKSSLSDWLSTYINKLGAGKG